MSNPVNWDAGANALALHLGQLVAQESQYEALLERTQADRLAVQKQLQALIDTQVFFEKATKQQQPAPAHEPAPEPTKEPAP